MDKLPLNPFLADPPSEMDLPVPHQNDSEPVLPREQTGLSGLKRFQHGSAHNAQPSPASLQKYPGSSGNRALGLRHGQGTGIHTYWPKTSPLLNKY